MTSLHRAAFAAALAGALAATLHEANDAQAFGIRRSAVECYVRSNDLANTMSNGEIVNHIGGLIAYCPTPEDASVSALELKTVNVHGSNAAAHDVAHAQACWNNWYDDGGGCQNLSKSPAGPGQFALTVGAPKFPSVYGGVDDANFKYIHVRLGTSSGNTPSRFRGIYFAN